MPASLMPYLEIGTHCMIALRHLLEPNKYIQSIKYTRSRLSLKLVETAANLSCFVSILEAGGGGGGGYIAPLLSCQRCNRRFLKTHDPIMFLICYVDSNLSLDTVHPSISCIDSDIVNLACKENGILRYLCRIIAPSKYPKSLFWLLILHNFSIG